MSIRIYGNRQLKTLPGLATRPTLARVREAIFNIWQGKIVGCRWLDLCTGTGSMGAEALCRGAVVVIGIEKSNRACDIIRQNWQQVANSEQKFEIIRKDVVQGLKTLAGQEFDLIYFDPPYSSDLYQPVLEAIANYKILSKQGEIAVEHGGDRENNYPESWEICRQKAYGNTALTFYRHLSSCEV